MANDLHSHDKRIFIQSEPSPSAVLDADREASGFTSLRRDHGLRHNLNSDLDYLPMKTHCDYCGGSGRVACDDCDGQGEREIDIVTMKIDRWSKNYDELIEIQKDAKRVIKQAERLKELRPSRSVSYDEQLRATLFVINAQAEEAAKKK